MIFRDQVANGGDVGEYFFGAALGREAARRRVRGACVPMPAMVVRIGVETATGEEVGEAGIAGGMLGKTVIDLHNAARLASGMADMEVQCCARR